MGVWFGLSFHAQIWFIWVSILASHWGFGLSLGSGPPLLFEITGRLNGEESMSQGCLGDSDGFHLPSAWVRILGEWD